MSTISLEQTRPAAHGARTALALAAAIFASPLPDVLWAQFFGTIPGWLIALKAAGVGGCLLASWVWKGLAPLRSFLILLALNMLGWWALPVVRAAGFWSAWEASVSWAEGMGGIQVLKLAVALMMLAALFILYRRRAAFFFTLGRMNAGMDPVAWLGVRRGTSWKSFAPVFALISAAVMLAVLALTAPLGLPGRFQALPLLPVAVLLAAANAFSEEVIFRAALLAPLETALGKGQALAVTAVFFGLAHTAGGVPLEVIPTALMTGFLGWVMGKSVLETRGLAWAWFIHFANDIPPFLFLGLAAAA